MMVLICFCLVYFDGHQFAAFRVPLDRRFLLSIPDLLEIPHVKLDATSQILFYSAVVQGLFIDPDPVPDRAILIRNIYLLVADLAEIWANSVQITIPDLYASFFVVSILQTQIVKKYTNIPRSCLRHWKIARLSSPGKVSVIQSRSQEPWVT